ECNCDKIVGLSTLRSACEGEPSREITHLPSTALLACRVLFCSFTRYWGLACEDFVLSEWSRHFSGSSWSCTAAPAQGSPCSASARGRPREPAPRTRSTASPTGRS